MRIRKTLYELFDVLRSAEIRKEKISREAIMAAAKWKDTTFQTYWNKGQLSPFLSSEDEMGPFEVSNCATITNIEFAKKLSQSKHIQELGHNCTSKLAKALLKRSKDNMILALEIYNRPSLDNRLDCFILCFCSAWEQLLKAKIIENKGEHEIYEKKSKIKFGKTISLRNAVAEIYNEDDSIRKNIERIAYYRDFAAHLVMPEVQGLLSRVFQSGVMNYAKEFESFSELPFLNPNQSGLLSIVGNVETSSVANLKQLYGEETGVEISELLQSLEDEIKTTDSINFAIPLSVKLVFAKDGDGGNPIILSRAEDGIDGLEKAIIIEKPIDIDKSHPYKESVAVERINIAIYSQIPDSALSDIFVAQEKKTGKPKLSTHDFRLIVENNGWKSNNKHHHKNTDPVFHRYSDIALADIIDQIMRDRDFIKRLRSKRS